MSGTMIELSMEQCSLVSGGGGGYMGSGLRQEEEPTTTTSTSTTTSSTDFGATSLDGGHTMGSGN